MDVVAFDALGTLFQLAPLEERLGLQALEAWFERLLHTAAVLTILNEFEPFDRLASSTLDTTIAKLELDVEADDLLGELAGLPPFPDARQALERAREAGDDVWVLTNGGRTSTEALLEQGGLSDLVAEVRTAEDVSAYKPDRRAYELLPRGATMVAAHGWDVLGAQAAGLDAVWVDRAERAWPFPGKEPRRAADLVSAVEVG